MVGGVSEYWIVDPREKRAVLYHFEENELTDMFTYYNPDAVRSIHFKGLEISMDNIFRE